MRQLSFLLTSVIISFLVACTAKKAKEKSATLQDLMQASKAIDKIASPLDSIFSGHHLRGQIGTARVVDFKAKKVQIDSLINELELFKTSNQEAEITKKVMLYKLKNEQSLLHFEQYLLPLNAEGGFYNQINFALGNLPFNQLEDYKNYAHWLSEYPKYLRQNMALLKIGIEENVLAAEVVAQNAITLLSPWCETNPENHILFKPLKRLPKSMTETEKEEARHLVAEVLKNKVIPTYAEVHAFFKTEYLPACRGIIGVDNTKNGKEFYKNRVAHYTTLSISPDSVFNLGLQEVERIQNEMNRVIQEAGFEGTRQEYIAFLRTDEQFYAKTPEQLLHYAAWLSKRAEAKLPQYFDQLYSLPFTVKPVDPAIAPTYTAGRYSGGSMEAKRAGEYWVNTYDLPSRPLYALPALTLHEAVPGHHLHNALVQEMDNLPEFRKHFYISAFGEGWGLYSEYLGEEMGMYQTPAEWFGRYTYEMWRACRLVVDVGLHQKGWSRQKAIDFLAENTALSMREVTTEINRYIGWPGQALSYKMGELKIKALRKKAKKSLQNDFDLRAFHNFVLSHGSIPLETLDDLVTQWIDEQKINHPKHNGKKVP